MPVNKICEICGKEFWVKPYKKDTAKYCSRKCLGESKKKKNDNKWIKKICPSCGKEFETLKSKEKKYCSQECNTQRLENKPPLCYCDNCNGEFIPNMQSWHKYINKEQKTLTCSIKCANELKKKGIIVNCDNCGSEIYRTPYRLNLREHQFCSIQCEKEFFHKDTYEIRKCEICNNEFECSKISTQRFCSSECQKVWQTTRVGILNPKYKRNELLCTYCNSKIYVPDYKLNIQNNFFCNKECRQKWYSEIFSQTEEWKEESRHRAVKILAKGQIPTTNTKPQIIINNLLDKNNIKYINEYDVDYYAIDIYLSEAHLMIEIMGDYWHSNPLIYDEIKQSDIQKTRVIKDKNKHKYVLDKYNIEILYLWETDIYKSIELCESLINLYINSNGLLDNYHSFNYIYKSDNIEYHPIVDMIY